MYRLDRTTVHAEQSHSWALERIKQLTGLDLSRHEDRMRADFALRLLQVNGTDDADSGVIDLIGGSVRSG